MAYDYSELVPYLLHWYDRNARILPWRENPRPYDVWVSEIMLQQTRVEAVKGYFDRFLSELPDIRALAEADEEKLLKLWEGLGYYNRVRNMQKAAKKVMEEFGGELPADYEALKSLPGIGSYTAGAIASIAFGLCEPTVDGNVLRVLKRVAASYDDITKEKVKRELEDDVRRVLPKERPGDLNQSLMELGATVCLPNGKPLCEQCPVMHLCQAFHTGCEMLLPVKPPKKERRIEERTVFVIRSGQKIALHKRAPKGLLAGLWELPNVEGYLKLQEIREMFPQMEIEKLPDAKHIFSHVEWRMQAYRIALTGKENLSWETMHNTGALSEKNLTDNGGKQLDFFTIEQISDNISLPSAFEAYRKYIR